MAKKNFAGGISSLIDGTPPHPNTNNSKNVLSSVSPDEMIRTTFLVTREMLEKLKAIAYWERELIQDVVNDYLTKGVAAYERKNGEVKPRPKK
jgi:hypothetical protein